ncbi:MAG TPA: hypothetical protein VGL84_05325 [Gaiellaceae bacterium]
MAAAATAVFAGAATAGLSWHEIAGGSAAQSSLRTAKAYVALAPVQERGWLHRLSARDRATVTRVSLTKNAVVAVFLDGAPCSTDVVVSGVTHTGRTIVVTISFKLPPPGVALCVRSSTPYLIIGVTRASLGGARPNRVSLVLHART